jgi:hypothetical protein
MGRTAFLSSADGLLVGPELGIEVAVDHVLIPIWLRFLYRSWSLDDAGTPNVSDDLEDYAVTFGTGLHTYF